jgi:ParB-like chromosome segregation protein Spo0J
MTTATVHCVYDKMVPIAKLKPNPANPNKHPASQVELLAKIISAHGWRAPITVSNRSGLIVRGHGRLEADELILLKAGV